MRRLGIAVNLAARVAMVAFTLEVLLSPDDPRFADKALGVRNLVIVGVASLLLPAWQLLRRRGHPYPVWYDNLYLSAFLLDQAGNSFDLYDTYFHFDLIPHAHNTGVGTIILAWLLRLSTPCAIGVVTVVHVLFELQEYYTDVFLGTRNVRGLFDTMNDLAVG
ncbi:MAG: hypothetical protein WEG56_08510, partial [Chloroflexota bacterium]